METTEKIVEAYVRYVKHWFSLPNIKCGNQKEIDLLALDPRRDISPARFHIESGVSISSGFSRLTNEPFSLNDLRVRVKIPKQRRTLGYFTTCKFEDSNVIQKLGEFGFLPGNYAKVIVSWGWRDEVPKAATELGIVLWDFRMIVREIMNSSKSTRTYFTDDTMRTLQLAARAVATGC
jgi:hypothetical protein